MVSLPQKGYLPVLRHPITHLAPDVILSAAKDLRRPAAAHATTADPSRRSGWQASGTFSWQGITKLPPDVILSAAKGKGLRPGRATRFANRSFALLRMTGEKGFFMACNQRESERIIKVDVFSCTVVY